MGGGSGSVSHFCFARDYCTCGGRVSAPPSRVSLPLSVGEQCCILYVAERSPAFCEADRPSARLMCHLIQNTTPDTSPLPRSHYMLLPNAPPTPTPPPLAAGVGCWGGVEDTRDRRGHTRTHAHTSSQLLGSCYCQRPPTHTHTHMSTCVIINTSHVADAFGVSIKRFTFSGNIVCVEISNSSNNNNQKKTTHPSAFRPTVSTLTTINKI